MTPHRAILITGVLALIFITLDNLELLAKIASVLQLYSYAALNIGCACLRAANPDWYRPTYRAPGFPFLQVLAALACLSIIVYSGFWPMVAVVALIVLSLTWYFVVARRNVEIEHGVPELKERWNSIGLATFFYSPEIVELEGKVEVVQPIAKRAIEPYSARHVVVALANPEHERALLEVGSLIARGQDEPGKVTGLHIVQIPLQTSLDVARSQVNAQKDVKRVVATIEAMDTDLQRDAGSPVLEPLITVAHDPFAVMLSETETVRGDLLLMGWEGGFNVGRIYESPVQSVIANAECDMGILKSRGDLKTIDKILLPWGGGIHARLGLEIAARVAQRTGAVIHLLRVVRTDVDVEQEERRVVESVMEIVEDVVSRGAVKVVYHVQRAERVTAGIRHQFDEEAYDLVIIGASREWNLRNVIFGAIPDVIADQSPCSVLMVRRYLPDHWSFKAADSLKRLREEAGFSTSPDEH